MHSFTCGTSQEAWEEINEYLFRKELKLTKLGEGRNGNAIVAYDVQMNIRKALVDPEFDFTKIFSYTQTKWSSLVKNYVDLNQLDLVKADVLVREKKKQQQYNVAFRFINLHNNGKDCLISATFTRRINSDIPTIVFHTRATEATKRLLWDFLLIERMGEYVYGDDAVFSITFIAPLVFITSESFVMYHSHRDLRKLVEGKKALGIFQQRTLELINKFMTIKPEELTYRVHRRSVRSLQGLPRGHKNQPNVMAKNCSILPKVIDYPDDVLTEAQKKKYRKKMNIK